MKKVFTGGVALMVALLAPMQVQSESFLPRQVTMVIPFPAGGPTDMLGRLVAQELGQRLKVPVIVENRAGASATIGSHRVAQAPADGGVLLFNATHHVTNPVFLKKLPYDTVKDFAPIALVASIPSVLVVHPSVSARSVADLIAQAKKEPGKLSMATFGGANQLSSELFKSMAGVDIENIGYSGEAPAVSGVLGGHVPMMFDTLSTVLPHIKAGKLRALGSTSAARTGLLPEVPTIAEAGPLPGYEAVAWFGLFMPAPGGAVGANLSRHMAEILASPETQKKLRALGAEPGNLTGEAFSRFVDVELKKWREVGERARIEKQ